MIEMRIGSLGQRGQKNERWQIKENISQLQEISVKLKYVLKFNVVWLHI